MSQGGNSRNSGGGGGGSGITQIDGNTGSTTGPIVAFTTNPGPGVTSSFTVAGATATLNIAVAGAGAITELAGDTGTAAGATVNVIADTALVNCGSSVNFTGNNVDTLTLNVTDANNNTMIGFGSGNLSLSGLRNSAVGQNSLFGLTNGNSNSVLGFNSGSAYIGAESSNILLNHTGIVAESNTLRIGGGTGTGDGQLQYAYISGIDSVDLGVANVVTENGDQLGTSVLTPGSGITITPGAGTITIAATGGGSGLTEIIGDSGNTLGPAVTFTTNPGVGLTSSFTVAGTTATLNLQLAGSGSLVINRQVFSAPGPDTYIPSPGLSYAIIEACGGGGGGAGTDINNVNPLFVGAGTGGGGGAYANLVLSAADIGASQTLEIGAGGAGITGSGTAPDGGDTTFGAFISCVGGAGGISNPLDYIQNISGGAVGGSSSGGDINIDGGEGGPALAFSMVAPAGIPGVTNFTIAQSGAGGNSFFGSGGGATSVLNEAETGSDGANGNGYGAGGSSAACCYNPSSVAQAGGDGANGVIIVTEFISNAENAPEIFWNVVTTDTSMSINNGYITNSGSLINLTLPAIVPVGSMIEICGINTGGWNIVQNAGQSIVQGISQSTVGVLGGINSTEPTDCIRMVCTVADTTFEIISSQGNPNIY